MLFFLACSLVYSGVYFFITKYALTRRLNLE